MLQIVSRLADDVSGVKARAAARVKDAEACAALYDKILHSLMFPAPPVAAASPSLPAPAAEDAPPTYNQDELFATQRAYASRLQVIDHGRYGLPAGAWSLAATPTGTALATRTNAEEAPISLPWEQLLARMALQQRLGG